MGTIVKVQGYMLECKIYNMAKSLVVLILLYTCFSQGQRDPMKLILKDLKKLKNIAKDVNDIKKNVKEIWDELLNIEGCSSNEHGNTNTTDGWVCHEHKCYKFFDIRYSFLSAAEYCTNEKAVLASIYSQSENDFIANLVGSGYAFVGGKGRTTWEWIYSTVKEMTYTNWAP